MRVVLFYRKYVNDQFSIESVFDSLLPKMTEEVQLVKKIMPFASNGFFKRICNMIYAFFNQGDVNHITGDVHYIALLLRKKKTILTIHDVFPMHQFLGLKRFIFKQFWFKLPIKRVALITTVSEFSRSEIEAIGIKSTPIRVIPNPLSLNLKYQKKPFNQEKPRILQVGTKPNKNIIRLANALHKIDCKLIVLGSLNTEQREELDRFEIDFEEYQGLSSKQVIEEYKKCDIVCFVSLYEGFGLPIIEGQAIGRVVLSSNCCSMPEVAGDGAHLINPYAVDQIRNGITLLINQEEEREKYIMRGLENVKSFSSEKIARAYLDEYKSIMVNIAR